MPFVGVGMRLSVCVFTKADLGGLGQPAGPVTLARRRRSRPRSSRASPAGSRIRPRASTFSAEIGKPSGLVNPIAGLHFNAEVKTAEGACKPDRGSSLQR